MTVSGSADCTVKLLATHTRGVDSWRSSPHQLPADRHSFLVFFFARVFLLASTENHTSHPCDACAVKTLEMGGARSRATNLHETSGFFAHVRDRPALSGRALSADEHMEFAFPHMVATSDVQVLGHLTLRTENHASELTA